MDNSAIFLEKFKILEQRKLSEHVTGKGIVHENLPPFSVKMKKRKRLRRLLFYLIMFRRACQSQTPVSCRISHRQNKSKYMTLASKNV